MQQSALPACVTRASHESAPSRSLRRCRRDVDDPNPRDYAQSVAVAAKLTACPNCGKTTNTIRGRCPNCAFLKHPEAAPPIKAQHVGGGSIWDDLEDLTRLALLLAPGVTLVVLALIFSLDVLLVVAVAMLAVPFAWRALVDWL
jgi:hypothetical protein